MKKTTTRWLGCAITAAAVGTSGCGTSPEVQAVLEEMQRWNAPEQTVDAMNGQKTWSVTSPMVLAEHMTNPNAYGTRVGLGISCSAGPENKGHLFVTVTFTAQVLSGGVPNEIGRWEHAVDIQWDGIASTARKLRLVELTSQRVGTVFVVRGDETENFVTDLATRSTLRMRIRQSGPIYQIPLAGARRHLAALAPLCEQGRD